MQKYDQNHYHFFFLSLAKICQIEFYCNINRMTRDIYYHPFDKNESTNDSIYQRFHLNMIGALYVLEKNRLNYVNCLKTIVVSRYWLCDLETIFLSDYCLRTWIAIHIAKQIANKLMSLFDPNKYLTRWLKCNQWVGTITHCLNYIPESKAKLD